MQEPLSKLYNESLNKITPLLLTAVILITLTLHSFALKLITKVQSIPQQMYRQQLFPVLCLNVWDVSQNLLYIHICKM